METITHYSLNGSLFVLYDICIHRCGPQASSFKLPHLAPLEVCEQELPIIHDASFIQYGELFIEFRISSDYKASYDIL